jgi:hypothetical protein
MPNKISAPLTPQLRPVPAPPRPAAPAPAVPARPAPATFTPAAPPRATTTSQIDFNVHPGIAEVRAFAEQQGWLAKGWTQLSTYNVDLVYTTDNWKTTKTASSSQVPSPYVNGRFILPDVPRGTPVEFAIKAYVAASDPHDIGGHRDRGEVWLNNGGRNFSQVTN